MFGKEVIIDFEDNFYDTMRGRVIEEYPQTVKVRIDFTDDWDDVMFYKNQIEMINRWDL